MLLVDFNITQTECNELIFSDTTPYYSSENPEGYGVFNLEPNEIISATITLDFGKGRVYDLSKAYNQTKGDWKIRASDLPVFTPTNTGCSDCGTPCGCEGCDDTQELDKDCKGFLINFPSGCMTIRYEVFTANNKSESLRVKKIISTCVEDKKLLDLADKLTMGQEKCYDFHNKKETRLDTMRNLNLAWTKLELLQTEENIDCDCVASRVKQIGSYLDSIEIQ